MKRNKFSLSNYKLLSCDMGELVPCGMFEVLPGDSVQQATSLLVRCSPLLAPIMHPVHVRVHHWFVPYRIIWDEFEDFITGGPNGTSAPTFPTVSYDAGVTVGTLPDYLGLPQGVVGLTASALPFRAYNLIVNEFYRDQDLQTEIPISTASGNDTTTEKTVLQFVDWEKDYFTSARPWEQKGPAVTVPIGTEAPVIGIGKHDQNYATGPLGVYESDAASAIYASYQNIDGGSSANLFAVEQDPDNAGYPYIRADLSAASAVTVNLLREALALQRYEEARARYGSRYVEYLRYLGVKSSDARLQRPEYLGGGKQTIQFSEVLSQTESEEAPIGTMKGHGIGAMRSNRYRRFFEEHGVVLSLLSVRPKTIYAQGMPRMWNRRNKEDFWQREFEHIGQQGILNREIYAGHSNGDGIFGYQDRYDEYRRQESTIAGEFRTVLDFWHMARLFGSDPALNASFVSCNPTDRVFAVPSEDTLYVMANHSIQARRFLSKRGSSFIF